MANWTNPETCRSLAVLAETVISPLLIEHTSPICLELEIETQLSVPTDPTRTAELLRVLAQQAIEQMPDGGDLTLTACKTPTGVELEIADTGCRIEKRERRLPLVAAAIDAKLVWQNCPQGGGAVTICFPKGQMERRAAA